MYNYILKYNNMKVRFLKILYATATALLLAACSQDEPSGQGNELPYGKYPLQIASVKMAVESNAEPWTTKAPQTRVTENNTDGKSSVWEWDGSEQIGVQLGDGDAAFYTLDVTKKVLPSGQQLYWTSTASTYVTAWYPTDETVDLSDQTERLAYVLQATQDPVSYDEQPVTLNFNHKLAKVRVLLTAHKQKT